METYDETTYGEKIAEVYDEWYDKVDGSAIATLRALARNGRALELAIGTGRVALPLHGAGVEVHGIDASPAMVARLRAKPGGEGIPVVMGNFADVAVEGTFSLIYIVFNTFFALLTQDEQVRCFANVARHLSADGVFVVEAFVPDLARYTRRQNMSVVSLRDGEARVDAAVLDSAAQLITSQHIVFTPQGTRMYPVKLRYAWPSELDLMARLAELSLHARWSNWKREPFTANSGAHVSVYGM